MVRESQIELRAGRTADLLRAKQMRHEPVSTEKLFWSCVRNRRLRGFTVKRQVPIGPFVADFVCTERKLIVARDGALHSDRKDYDASRDGYLESQGFEVLRFVNDDFAGDITLVLKTIARALGTPSPRPLPPKGERKKH